MIVPVLPGRNDPSSDGLGEASRTTPRTITDAATHDVLLLMLALVYLTATAGVPCT
jgi:hypothetical protein